MDSNKVDMFILSNGKFFESNQLMYIREQLLAMDDSKWSIIQTIQFKDPTTSIIVSILAGGLGIDRFMIGDTGLGIGKLLTCGGLGIWAIVDFFEVEMGSVSRSELEGIKVPPFGLGLERTVSWICGLDHLREAIPFPRMIYRNTP